MLDIFAGRASPRAICKPEALDAGGGELAAAPRVRLHKCLSMRPSACLSAPQAPPPHAARLVALAPQLRQQLVQEHHLAGGADEHVALVCARDARATPGVDVVLEAVAQELLGG
jgi:hypothetical protein